MTVPITFAKDNGIPMTAVQCRPHFDEKKNRVGKGETIPHKSWKVSGGFEADKIKSLAYGGTPTAFMMDLRKANMYVLDIDVKNGKTAQDIVLPNAWNELIRTCSYAVQTGSGGAHFYFSIPANTEEHMKTNTKIRGFDILVNDEDGEIDLLFDSVLTEGSVYIHEGKHYTYTAIQGTIYDVKPDEAMWKVVKLIITSPVVLPVKSTTQPLQGKFLTDIVMNIAPNEKYEDWVKIGIAIRSAGGAEELFHQWSKQSSSYDERECSKKWLSFPNTCALTAGSLFHWSEQSNPVKHAQILQEHRKNTLWDLITLLNHKDIACYFHSQHPDSYLWNEGMGWFLLGKTNIWFQSEKQTPSGLKRHIADVMMNIFQETKKIELREYTAKSVLETDPKQQDALTSIHKSRISLLNTAYKVLGSDTFCNGVVAFLPSYYEVRDLSSKMNMNRNLFAFTDKVYDLEAGTSRDICPKDYISITTGYAYPEASNKGVRQEISALLYGMFECEETQNYLMYVLGSCLLGNNKFEEFYIFTGSGGNGKGVINEILRHVFGDYYISVDVSLFTKPVDKRDQPVPALVEAQYKRVMITTEPEKDDKLQVGLLKKMSGNDIIEARTLHCKTIVKYIPQYKTIIQANSIPKLNKIDGGVSRRLRVIHFPFKFVEEEALDMNMNNRLGSADVKDKKCRSPEWRDEFCLMLLETYNKVKHMKSLVQPKEVKEATGEYMDDNNPIKLWLEAKYEHTNKEKDMINATELKQAFLTDTSTEKMSDVDFKGLMGLNNIHSKRTNACVVYYGIVRKEEA